MTDIDTAALADDVELDDEPYSGWMGYSTCTGYLVLAVEADPDVAAEIAEADGIDLSTVCGQCYDTDFHEHELDAAAIAGLDPDRVLDAAAVTARLAEIAAAAD